MRASGERHPIKTADGLELALFAYGPPAAGRAVLVLHGIESHAGWFKASCEALAASGLRVACLERRGSGTSGGPRGHAPSTVLLMDDLRRALEWLREELPARPIQAVAHSWGAVYALAYLGREPAAFERLSLVGPGLFPLVDLSAAQKLEAALGSLASPEHRLPIPIEGPGSFTANPGRLQAIRDDPLRLKEATTRFFVCAWMLRLRALAAARRSAAPTAVYLAGRDAIIDTEGTRRFFFRCGKSVVVETFEEARHTLEFEADPSAFLASIVRWCTTPPGLEVEA